MSKTARAIIDIITSQISREDSLPVLSKAGLALQTEFVKKEPDTKKIVKLIMMEPALTGDLLRMANSPFYRGLEEVTTVKEAILRLGFEELSKLVMASIHRSNFKSNDPVVRVIKKRLWVHSLSCAIGSNWLAKRLKLDLIISQSFVAGLLHDMGKLYLLTAIERIRENKDIQFNPSTVLIYKILDNLHTTQGFDLLTTWHIPEEYRIIARDHHKTDFDHSDLLLTVVRLVNNVSQEMEKTSDNHDMGIIVGSVEADILDVSEITIAEMEIAIEEAMKRFA